MGLLATLTGQSGPVYRALIASRQRARAPTPRGVDAAAGSGVLDRLRSAPLKDAIRALATQGTAIDVMPDYDDHLHVTRN